MPDTSEDLDRFCITDIGSTTTKAILFEKRDGKWHFIGREAPTTVERPQEDVAIGVINTLEALEDETGHHLLKGGIPCLPYFCTSSAGGGLNMVVTGLVLDLTAESANRAALGAGAIVLDVIALDDGRTPYRKIEDLKLLRPDMVLLAGGFDGDNVAGPVYLAELIVESGLHPKLDPSAKLDIVYAGNVNAREYAREVLRGDFAFHPVANIRPDGRHENPEPARKAIHSLFMDHVMSQAPGYGGIKSWVSAPIRPTPAAFANILGTVSKDMGKPLMAVDVGGATTDVFTAARGNVFRTVSANLGMSYSIRNVVESGGIERLSGFHRLPLTDKELWNHIGNKHINPTGVPSTHEGVRIEWAVATMAIREAVNQHFRVMHATADETSALGPEGLVELRLEDYGMVIGSGGILSHSPRDAAAAMLLDALEPTGIMELAVDSAFMFPHLGVLAEVNENLAKQIFHEIGLLRLGTIYAPAGQRDPRRLELRGRTAGGRGIEVSVNLDEVRSVPLGEDEKLRLARKAFEVDRGLTARGGVCGLIVDNRTRPVEHAADALLLGDHVPAAAQPEVKQEAQVREGTIILTRELAIPGNVLVSVDDKVETDTIVARSTRQFLRPFFIEVTGILGIPPEDTEKYLIKRIGDEIAPEDVIARRARDFLPSKTVRSNVRARIERILPNGTVLARELPEMACKYVTVNVAEELGRSVRRIASLLRVEVGQAVERGQWLAADIRTGGVRYSAAPIRGMVNRIDLDFGMVVIEPLLEELEVRAWLPGRVQAVSDKGCVLRGSGTVIHGIWGLGGESAGALTLGAPEQGKIVVRHFADNSLLAAAKAGGAAGLIAAGLDLKDVIDPKIGLTIVLTGGFGRQVMASEVYSVLESHAGRLALIDGTTQLRVGVRRPTIILPDPVDVT
jgi:uncharacterized protein (TIGR01319 family)